MSGMNPAVQADCTDDRRGNIARSLLGWLALAGPIYLVTSVTQGLLRPGFDFTRHSWSLLANGELGWIQTVNLLLSGAMVIAGALGVRMVVGTATRAARWMPRLLAGYGAGLVLAGLFRADPADGFPVGTPVDQATITWHGTLHLAVGGLGFACLVAACLLTAALHRRRGETGKAWLDTGVGIFFGLSFLGLFSGSTAAAVILGFTAGVVVSLVWLTWHAVELYRRSRVEGTAPDAAPRGTPDA